MKCSIFNAQYSMFKLKTDAGLPLKVFLQPSRFFAANWIHRRVRAALVTCFVIGTIGTIRTLGILANYSLFFSFSTECPATANAGGQGMPQLAALHG
jgi:hypothetical protein